MIVLRYIYCGFFFRGIVDLLFQIFKIILGQDEKGGICCYQDLFLLLFSLLQFCYLLIGSIVQSIFINLKENYY